MMARIYFPPELHVMVPCWRRRVGPWHLFFFCFLGEHVRAVVLGGCLRVGFAGSTCMVLVRSCGHGT